MGAARAGTGDRAVERARHDGRRPLGTEGLDDATWVLLDYGDVVVHVMSEETRAYYSLERLWADMPRVAWSDAGPSGRVGPAGRA